MLEMFSDEVFLRILKNLDVKDLGCASQACTKWTDLAKDVWKEKLEEDFKDDPIFLARQEEMKNQVVDYRSEYNLISARKILEGLEVFTKDYNQELLNIMRPVLLRGFPERKLTQDEFDAMKLLIYAGANLNYKQNSLVINKNHNPLCFAIHIKDLKLIECLLAHGSKINFDDLLAACETGNHEMVTLLEKYGANLKEKSKHGKSLINILCETGSVNGVELCINRGFDLNARDQRGYTLWQSH